MTLAGWQEQRIDLPLNVANPDNLTVEAAGLSARAAVARNGDVRVIRVEFDRVPPGVKQLRIRLTAKGLLNWERARSSRGTYSLSYTFANATSATIGDYAFKLLLPAGYTIRSITSSTPRATGEEVEPPYGFATEDGRVALSLRAKPVAPGKFAAIAFGFESTGRNPLPAVIIGLLVALAGLYLKRDVLSSESFERKIAG